MNPSTYLVISQMLLTNGGVSEPEEMGHLQLCVDQRDGLHHNSK
jgi:hypothetical protein